MKLITDSWHNVSNLWEAKRLELQLEYLMTQLFQYMPCKLTNKYD